MTVLTRSRRRRMPRSDFAGPKAGLGADSYPDSDPTHARLAISGARHAERVGNISAEQEKIIESDARKHLKGSKKNSGAKRRTGKTKSWTGA